MKLKDIIIGVLLLTNLLTVLMMFSGSEEFSKIEVEKYYQNIKDSYEECQNFSKQMPLSKSNQLLIDQTIIKLADFEQDFLVLLNSKFDQFEDAIGEEFYFLSKYKDQTTTYCQLVKELDSTEGVIDDYEFDILQTDKSMISIINGMK